MKPAIEPVIRMRPCAARAHVAADLLDEIDRAGDVGVDHVPHLVKSWSRKPCPSPWPALASSASTGRPPRRRESRSTPSSVARSASTASTSRRVPGTRPRLLDFGLVGGDHQVEAVLGAGGGYTRLPASGV